MSDKWYNLNGSDAASSVIATYEEISRAVSEETDKHYALKELIYPDPADSNNVARSIMETATSHFGSIRPKPFALTYKGDYTLKRRAKLLNQFAVGLATGLDMYSLTKQAFEDAWIYGDGFVRVLDLEDDIGLEYVPSYEVRVDPVDGKYGDPQAIYIHKLINKSVLLELFPGKEIEIDDAGTLSRLGPEHEEQRDDMEDACSVVMAWRKASGPDANDGKYIVAVDGGLLDMGVWEDDELPVYRFSIGKRNDKYYSYGSVRIIAPIQREIDTVHEKISGAYDEWCVKMSVTNNKSAIDKDGWDPDKFFEAIEGDVQFVVPQLVSPDLIQYLQTMRQQAFELSGISEMHASSKKVPGVEAGVAIRELNDIQSIRFQSMNQDYERFHLDIFKAFVRLAKRIDERGEGSYKIMAESRDGIEQLNWSDVRLDDDKFQLQIWPASLFSGSPAAQLQAAQDLVAIAPQMQEYVLQMMDIPDVHSHLDRVNAPRDIIEAIIEKIIDKGEFIGPQPFFDLKFCINEMLLAYNQALLNKIEEERLELMIDWMTQADEILNPRPPESQQLPPEELGPGGMPPQSAPPGMEGASIGPGGMPPGPPPSPEMMQAMPQPQMPPPGLPPGV
jgi:hypothetical protein